MALVDVRGLGFYRVWGFRGLGFGDYRVYRAWGFRVEGFIGFRGLGFIGFGV